MVAHPCQNAISSSKSPRACVVTLSRCPRCIGSSWAPSAGCLLPSPPPHVVAEDRGETTRCQGGTDTRPPSAHPLRPETPLIRPCPSPLRIMRLDLFRVICLGPVSLS